MWRGSSYKVPSRVAQSLRISNSAARNIENGFSLDKEIFTEVLNKFLKIRISDFDKLSPDLLYETNFKKQTPKVHDYDDLERKIYKEFEDLNRKTYKIITKEGGLLAEVYEVLP